MLHRPRTLKPEDASKAAPPVMVFDAAGNYVKSWGGAGDGFDWPQREHGIHIDHKGFVWIGGNNCPTSGLAGLKPVADDALLKFTLDGKFVMQIGKSNQSKGDTDTANVHRAADAWVPAGSNEVFVADGYGNHRVIVFDADTGAFKRMWGAVRHGRRAAWTIARSSAPSVSRMAKACRTSTSRTPSASPTTARCISPTAKTAACRCSRATANS